MSIVIDKSLSVDTTNQHYGYIVAQAEESDGAFKVRVSTDSFSYLYDMMPRMPVVIPLQMGNGLYIVELYQNINKNKYAEVGAVEFFVELIDEYAPFLHSNQYVDYEDNKQIIEISDYLSCIDDIMQYIEKNFVYDYIYAVMVKQNTLPNINRLLSTHMGICQDISALTVALLRLKCVPAKLVIGMADKKYHAWVSFFTNDFWHLYDPTAKIIGLAVNYYEPERIY